MGVILNREEDKNEELTRKINADLRAKMEASSKDEGELKKKSEKTDFSEDVDYNRGTKKTSKFGWVVPLSLFVAFIVAIVAIFALK